MPFLLVAAKGLLDQEAVLSHQVVKGLEEAELRAPTVEEKVIQELKGNSPSCFHHVFGAH
jgi:hypothetical protein